MKRLFCLLTGLLFIVIGSDSRAQVSVELGAGYAWQSGSFLAPCGCTFGFGSGTDLIGDVSYGFVMDPHFSVGLKAGLEYQRLTAHEVTAANTNARIANGDEELIKIAYVTFDPYLRYTVSTTKLFVQASPGVGYVVSRAFHHNTGSSSDGSEVVLNPDSVVDINAFRYSAKLAAGYAFPLSGITLTPMLTYVLPLNALSTSDAERSNNGAGWSIAALYMSLAVEF